MRALARTMGARLLSAAVRTAPKLYIRVLNDYYDATMSLSNADWPAQLEEFEDLTALFVGQPRPAPQTIAAMDLDEAAYLFRVLRSVQHPAAVEIGRYKGGGTILMASAIRNQGTLLSIDNHALVGRRAHVHTRTAGAEMDAACARVLDRYGLSSSVTLAVSASDTIARPEQYNVVFFDGDHSYDGVKRDMDWWLPGLMPGGHALFHDVNLPGVSRAVRELRPAFTRVAQAGHLGHFMKRAAE